MSKRRGQEHKPEYINQKKASGYRRWNIWLMLVVMAVFAAFGIQQYKTGHFSYVSWNSKLNQLEVVTLVRVVDGDTILVEQGGENIRVRLLCVDCEESVHPDTSKNTEKGQEASAFTTDYLSEYSTVYLQYDEERYDQYGRTLAYVWLSDSVDVNSEEDIKHYMLNAILLEEDMATVVVYEPNHRYAELFYELEGSD